MNEQKKRLVLIDSNAIIHRAYHALPKNMSTSKGELTNAVYGFATTLIKVLEDLHPTHIAASFDVGKATERIAQYADYKATRVKADQELYDQIPKVKDMLEAFNIPVYTAEGHEADDCIGTISDKFEERNQVPLYKDFEVYIISGDKDIFQLVDGNIFVYWLKKGLSEAGIINRKVIEVEWGLQPEDFIDLKALAGDSSDNIPGVPGIGPKTATELLKKFDTLEKLYEGIEALCHSETKGEESQEILHCVQDDKLIESVAKELNLKPRVVRLLIENKEQALMSQKLATINRNVPIDFSLEDCEWGNYDKEKVRDFFEKMQFHSLLKRFGAERGEAPETKADRPLAGKTEQQEKDEQLKLL